MTGQKIRDASVAVAVPVIMVPMMIPVPSLPLVPPIFIGVPIAAIAVPVVVVRSVLLVSRANVDAEPIFCFRLSGCQSNQPEGR